MDLNTYGNIADIVAVPIAIIGVLIVAHQLYLSRKEEQVEHRMEQKKTTLHDYNLVREDLSKRVGKIRKELGIHSMYTPFTEEHLKRLVGDKKLKLELSIILSAYERFAIGVHHGVYNKELIYDLSGSSFIQIFKQFKPYIHHVREQQPYFLLGLESLIVDLEKIRNIKKEQGFNSLTTNNC